MSHVTKNQLSAYLMAMGLKERGMSPKDWGQSFACAKMVRKNRIRAARARR